MYQLEAIRHDIEVRPRVPFLAEVLQTPVLLQLVVTLQLTEEQLELTRTRHIEQVEALEQLLNTIVLLEQILTEVDLPPLEEQVEP